MYFLNTQLADFGNLTQPWTIDEKLLPKDPAIAQFSMMRGFKNKTEDVPIAIEDLEQEYCRLMKQPYPIYEIVFVRSWTLFRVSPQLLCHECILSRS
jgi:hypothetical protein